MLEYFIVIGIALLSSGIGGVIASRHLVVVILSIEIMLIAASLLAVSLYGYSNSATILPLLFVIWAIAAIDVIALVVFYRYLSRFKMDLNVTKLSHLKER
ncbi:MAG: NADH-quinone oxidoreductase subunit K [Candidatus Marsarchaeota archaeon]|jgi:NADH:ubiquinone oxidoreductase subunit K|nr:NADH-quinone oxidoreductase subunit K [Candidatus Marsarchaeota archaeon]MCL5115520.1 NADH-quinone oxidoreductase subunit K [Candidatus Marsarchaeota archaeon]